MSINEGETELGAYIAYVDKWQLKIMREGSTPFSIYPDGPHFYITTLNYDTIKALPHPTSLTHFTYKEKDLGSVTMMEVIAARDFGHFSRKILDLSMETKIIDSEVEIRLSGRAGAIDPKSMLTPYPSVRHGIGAINFHILLLIKQSDMTTFFGTAAIPPTWSETGA